jgi:outer membrane biosynthesis protein TonB
MCRASSKFDEAVRTDEALTSAGEGLPDADAAQRGSLSAHLIREVIRAALPQVTACANDAERAGASANGRVTIRFLIVSDGSVAGGQVEENTGSSRALACCILQHVAGLRFPAPDGGGRVSVTYPWTID